MLTEEQRCFLAAQRVARLATADAAGRPHVVPICYALAGNTVYFTIDEKPLVLEAFESTFSVVESAEEDDWWALVLTKT